MRFRIAVRLLFILYCVEAGTLLVLSPWSSIWDRMVMQAQWTLIRDFGLQPLLRSIVSGFGLVHLVMGVHDLSSLLGRRRKPAARRTARPGSSP
jgi:hypothetical protein